MKNQLLGKTVGTMGIMWLLLATTKTISTLKTPLYLAVSDIFQKRSLFQDGMTLMPTIENILDLELSYMEIGEIFFQYWE